MGTGDGDAMNADRRAAPCIWEADWHVLRGLGKAIRSMLADSRLRLSGARVIDFGCGSRPYAGWFTALGARYEGAEIDSSADVRVNADGTIDAADARYDLVASFQVLEHVWDVGAYLREARRVLKRDGWLLLSTHGAWPYHPHPEDYRRWTAQGLKREVEAHGFRLERILPVVGPLAWTTVFRALAVAHVLSSVPLLRSTVLPISALLLNSWAWLEDQLTPSHITANNACVYVCLFARQP